MSSFVKYNSEDQTKMEMGQDPKKERGKQEENKQEMEHIKEKRNANKNEKDEEMKDEMKKRPGNTLDASGHVHTKNEDPNRLQNDSELNAYTSQQERLGDQQAPNLQQSNLQQKNSQQFNLEQFNDRHYDVEHPTAQQPIDQPQVNQQSIAQQPMDQKPINQYPTSGEQETITTRPENHRVSTNPSPFNQTFDSALSGFNDIFNTADPSMDKQRQPGTKLNNTTPLEPISPNDLVWNLQLKALKYIFISCLVSYLLGKWRFSITIGVLSIITCGWAYWNLGKESSDAVEWQIEKEENMRTLYTSEGESVEWLNYMLEKIWRSIDPQIFADIEDLLEDTLQSVAPSFIKSVKVYDLDIGVQAPRIQVIRVFPPLPGQPEESIFGEAAFSFHAHPVASLVTHRGPNSTPPGLTICFQTAVKAPLEVKAELTAISGKIRFKLLTSPEIPFISKATIAFTSVPKVETGVMPLSKHLNIMNLPAIKTLVNEGIKLGCADMVDPKSMTVDIQALLGAFTQDTFAIGVVKVLIREATRDKTANFQDMEDSYATLSLSNQPKKTVSSTRVLTNDENPRWNEDLYVLVYKDDIISETKVDIKVWDADKVKFDDMWGSVSMSVKDIVQGEIDKLGNVKSWCQDECVIFDGWTPIDGKNENNSKIKLNMKLSFHPKYPTPNMEIFTSKSMKQKKKSEEAQKEEEKRDKAILDIPVDPTHTNGILSILIHQAVDLEIGDPEVLPTNEEFKHPYSPDKVVSPYAVLYINDNKVYQTRTKLRNPSPHWNAVSENFIKDFDNCSFRISVKTAFDLERDAVLGTKVIHLKDVFRGQENAKFKQIQQWIPLANGIGFGKVLLTIKYKPVKLTLPHELQGCDVGTLIVERLTLNSFKSPLSQDHANSTKVTLSLNVNPIIKKRLKPKNISKQENGGRMTETYGWCNQHYYFPLMMRYRTALYVHVTQGTVTSHKCTGRFWLKDMVDHEWQDIKVGLYDYVSESSKESNRNEDAWSEEGDYGQVTIRMKISPGFSPVHTHLRSYIRDMVGADPFYNEALKFKAQRWIKEQSKKKAERGEEPDAEEDTNFDYDLQNAVQSEKERMDSTTRNRRASSLSSEYGEETAESDMDDYEIEADMFDQKKDVKISKHGVLRKVAWGIDKVKHKVDVLKEGFNSETRADRSVIKET
ncbi:uncharacterized protein BX663DRAFT_508770 [Cokeromyces recurvatus]|uniref:uncharacterized protein n=1 Tax=Cokeromyces recurvatus TaxID=90255 RepID=UPI002220B6C4|nr:uncharacterized protein BX663DRAFT_508770 [Cokeromyces recurvatus]KAI7902890.1 hypothetical protein BX663DRAFT_508770 [Cokeromyces recurvatus]